MTNLQIYLFSTTFICTLFVTLYFGAGFKKPIEAIFGLIYFLFFYSILVLFTIYPLHSQTTANIIGVVVVMIAVAIGMARRYFVKRAEQKIKQ